jgi:predicted GH43/DUF377 family glycosyl hydrolase
MKPISIKRSQHRLLPDVRRVLAKPYYPPGADTQLGGPSRIELLIARIMAVPEAQLKLLNTEILQHFEERHHGFSETLERHFDLVSDQVSEGAKVSSERRRLVGAYFTHEYSIEAAALCNPSIVLAPDQRGLANGAKRFIMSLRAVGEGHLSSIEFRSGVLDAAGGISIDAPGTHVEAGRRSALDHFDKKRFSTKLRDLGAVNELSSNVLARLGDSFTSEQLEAALVALAGNGTPPAMLFETVKVIRLLASSNYVTTFPADSDLAERVIFPAGPNESHGMEDARFVRFIGPNASVKYFATYTACDGFAIVPQLIQTEDFVRFDVSTLHGTAAQNKGMALFPRAIDGKYAMLSRKDAENLHLSVSDDMHHWDDATELYRPQNAWELQEIGNCGSPIETDAGWLVLTHGVGPMRRHAIGALLLDLEHPQRVIGYLKRPLLEPDEDEREGYSPNVLYTCGAIVHAGQLIIPYGFSDSGVAIAQLAQSELLAALLESQPPRTSSTRSAA